MRFLLLLAALLAAGCADREAAETTPPDPTAAETTRPDETTPPAGPGVSLTALVDAALHRPPGTDTLAVLDRLNEPQRLDVETQPNRHDEGQIDTLRTYHYDGLRFTVYHVASPAKEILSHLEVTGPAYETARGLRVGQSRTEVERLRGAPDRTEDGAYVYEGEGPTPNPLFVRFDGDAVSMLEWRFYVD